MASFTDSLGRTIEDASLNASMLESMLNSAVGPKQNPPTGLKSKSADKLEALLDKLNVKIEKGLGEANRYLQEIQNAYKGFDKGKSVKKDISTLVKHATKRGSIFTHDVHVEKALKDIAKGSGKIPHSGSVMPLAKGKGKAMLDKEFLATLQKTATANLFGKAAQMAATLNNLIGDPIGRMFDKGMYERELDFNRQMRRIAFEVNGVTGNLKKMQREWETVESIAAETGVSREVGQKVLIQLLRKGIKDRKTEINVMKAGLGLSYLIDSSAENTAEMFHDWHMQLGFSENSLFEISRSMQRVARETGVSGDNLIQVAKQSEVFLKNMRNAGTLTSGSVEQLTMVLAEAQKLGVLDKMSNLLDLASSSTKLMNGSPEMKRLLFFAAGTVGQTNKLLSGKLLESRGGREQLAKGLENVLKNFGVTLETIGNLSDEQRRVLNLQLSQAFGVESEELVRVIESLRKGSQSLTQRFEEFEKVIKNANSTDEEITRAKQDRERLVMESGFSFMTKLDESIVKTKAKNIEQAFAGMKLTPDQRADMDAMLKQEGINLGPKASASERMIAVSRVTAKKLKEAGGKDFTDKIEAAIRMNDMKGFRTILAQMNKEQMRLQTDTKAATNPIDDLNKTIMKTNEILSQFINPLLQGVVDFIGPTGLLITSIISKAFGVIGTAMMGKWILGSLLGGGGGGGKGIFAGIKGMFTGIKNLLFGTGGAGAKGISKSLGLFGAIKNFFFGAGAAKGALRAGGLAKGLIRGIPGILGAILIDPILDAAQSGIEKTFGVESAGAKEKLTDAKNVTSGYAQGALFGSMLGPVGTAAGAAIGAGYEIGKIAYDTKKINDQTTKGINKADEIANKGFDIMKQEAAKAKSIDERMSILDEQKAQMEKMRGGSENTIKNLEKNKYGWYNPTSWFGGNRGANEIIDHEKKLQEKYSAKIKEIEAEQSSLRAAREEAGTAVRTAADMHEAALLDKRGTEAGIQKFTNDELVSLEENSKSQLDEMTEMKQIMQKLLDVISSGQLDQNKPGLQKLSTRHAPDYGLWQMGKYNQTANRQVVSDGVNN